MKSGQFGELCWESAGIGIVVYQTIKIICGVGTYNFKPDEYETGRYGGIQLAEGCTVSGPDENGIYTVTAE